MVINHPHPLQGGSAEHKIPAQLAKTAVALGYMAVRPNFRGVGATEGQHDGGYGETTDSLTVAKHIIAHHPDLPVVLAGFSFGAFIQANVIHQLEKEGISVQGQILIGAPYGLIRGEIMYDTPIVPASALIIHGEQDDVVPLSQALNWARPQQLPVMVIPGANHFFSGKLMTVQTLFKHYLGTRLALA